MTPYRLRPNSVPSPLPQSGVLVAPLGNMHDTTTRPLTATYRLQLNKDFTLHDARARVPYLQSLGISHLYCSPVLAARAGSMHGYDVADPTHVSAELGGDSAFAALAETAHSHGLGIILDIVPNHMGIGRDNPFWEDVLTHGATSQYAAWFDVEWSATRRKLAGKLLVPILGDTLPRVIARDELQLHVSDRGVRVKYFDHDFPIDPASLPPELELAQRDPWARELVAEWPKGGVGRARLKKLLAAQHYELAFWRTASRDLNYRRFFDVNELIALRVEQREVFDATHRVVLQMVANGLLDGLRIDHIDGLLEPRRYLERLRAAVDARQPRANEQLRFPIYVEKILAAGERLPPDWPVDGTTGYEFMTAVEDVFIDPAGYERLESRYRGTGESASFHAVAMNAKRRVLRGGLNADVRRIAPMLAGVARQAGWPTHTIGEYAMAIVELVVALPVYRTYMDAERPEPGPADRAVLQAAFELMRRSGRASAGATDALERALLGSWTDPNVDERIAHDRLAFVLRWQQLTGPAAAKGVEDTALYAYAPLASRNEVGGDPGVPVAGAITRLHELLAERARHHPRCLNATNTHDTKRSADVRSRLDALSEHAGAWQRRLAHWRRHHRDLRTLVGGRLAPTRTTDNFIYQSLLGIWPLEHAPSREGNTEDDVQLLASLRERLTAYIAKAVREAKVNTSWTDPDADYEAAINRFIAGLLDRGHRGDFRRELAQFAHEIQAQGIWNALARLTVHLSAPGVPDLYQGDELWFQALVDPDNRRPVDWGERDRLIASLPGNGNPAGVGSPEELAELLTHAWDGRLKLYVIRNLLRFRRNDGALMAQKQFRVPLLSGAHADRIVAFERTLGTEDVLVLVPRLTSAFGGRPPVGEAWDNTAVAVEANSRWRCILSGVEVGAQGGKLAVRDALAWLPVAVLVRAD